MRFKKTALMVLLVLLALLSACKQHNPAVLTVDGKKVSMPYVMKINREKITLEEYRHYFRFEALFDDNAEYTAEENAAFRASAAERLIYNSAMKAMAKERGLSIAKEDNAAIKESIQASIEEEGGRAEYLKTLEEYDLTEEVFKKLLWENILYSKLAEALFGEAGEYNFSEEELLARVNLEEYLAVRYIYQPLDQEGSTRHKDAMTEAEAKLAQGEDFEELLDEYCQDSTMYNSNAPQIFLKGTEIEAFENAVLALEEGEKSSLVETKQGYYLLHRIPVDLDLLKSNLDMFRMCEQEKVFKNLLEKAASDLEVEYHKDYDLIAMDTLS